MAAMTPSGSRTGRRDRKQDAQQNIDMAAAAIQRSIYFNVCHLDPKRAEAAARALARAAVRALHGRTIRAGQ